MKNPLWRWSHAIADQHANVFDYTTCTSFSKVTRYTCNLHSSRCCLDAIWHFNSCLVLFYCCFFFPTHITPPYCFHSNAITEMTAFSCCYHSSLSSVHIWRLSSSRERCSLQQIANCGAGSGCMCLLHGASLRTTLSWNAFRNKSLQRKWCLTFCSQKVSCKCTNFRHILMYRFNSYLKSLRYRGTRSGGFSLIYSVGSFLCWVVHHRANTRFYFNCSLGTHSCVQQWPWMDTAMTWAAVGGSVNLDTDSQGKRLSVQTQRCWSFEKKCEIIRSFVVSFVCCLCMQIF